MYSQEYGRRLAIGRGDRRAQGGRCRIDGRAVAVVDLPGIYSFDAASLDEQVTQDYLLAREADLVVNVIDAANLERNLYFSVQLLEMGVPLVVALNMMDVARRWHRDRRRSWRGASAARWCRSWPRLARD